MLAIGGAGLASAVVVSLSPSTDAVPACMKVIADYKHNLELAAMAWPMTQGTILHIFNEYRTSRDMHDL